MGDKTNDKAAWKPVPGHDGYFASWNGKLMSMRRGKPVTLKPIQGNDGHLYVFMDKRKVYVHRAVLSAWTGENKENLLCRHLDDNPENNCVENLCWGTALQNTEDKRKNGGMPVGERSSSHKVTESQVMEIRERYASGESSRGLAREYGIGKNAVLQIIRGETWSHLPLIPIIVRHSSKRITPVPKDQIEKFVEGGKRYAASRKKPRILITCACGCGGTLETPDAKGRERKYIWGHNTSLKYLSRSTP